MRCSNCGKNNPQGLNFCNQCGAGLKPRCSRCGFENEPGARFCGNCGTSLNGVAPVVERTDAAGATAVRPQSQFGERRHLTVLFCDLVGSTELAAQLDPEEWHELIAIYHRSVAEAVSRFGGRVAKFLGDGVMAYFGYPEAHDNDAECAARAGLGMIEAISKLHQEVSTGIKQSTRPRLSARIGIDSGRVVVSTGAGTGIDIFGEAPNIAARVQAAAVPDTVLITASTYRLVAGLFVVEDCGAHAFKGIEQPVQLYRVVQPESTRGRLAAAASHGLTPFVGREDELALLTNRWQRVLEGEGQVVLIMGEPGIGKSRLVQQFRQYLSATAHTWIEAAAAPFYQNTPFYPIAEALWQLVWEQSLNRFGDYLRKLQRKESGEDNSEDAVADERLDDLHSGLISAGLTPAEAIPLLAPLMHLPMSANVPSALTPEQQRRRLLATLVEWLLGAARSQPLVIVIEDLHWADPSTLELIQLLAEQGAAARLLLLYTARPEFRPEWPLRAHHAQIALNRLNARDVRAMIAQVAAQNALANQAFDAVVKRTSGVPLFVEELTRALLESGSTALSEREIPVTLHDSLMARLDRLGSAKEVLQIGSVIGGEFSYELLRAIHPIDEEKLQRELRRLTDADLVHVRGLPPNASYQFKHALIRDAAYEALLKSRRKELHRQVACAIDHKFADIKDAHPEVLARHWSEGGEPERAITEWTRAGKAAESRNGFKEALENFQQAVSLIPLLPESHERDLREFELRQSVYTMVYLARGLASPEARDATERVSASAEKIGDLPEFVSSLSSRGLSAYFAGNFRTARKFADQILALGTRESSPVMLAHGHFLAIVTCNFLGELQAAEEHFAAGSPFFADAAFRRNPGTAVAAIGGASLTAWGLGRSDLAREREEQMMAVVNANSPYDVASAQIFAANLKLLFREYEQAQALAAQALQLSQKHQLGYPFQFARCVLGHAWSKLGRTSDGIELLREGIAGSLDSGIRLRTAYFTAAIAEAQTCDGNSLAAIETIDAAAMANPEELFYRAETFRLRGEIRIRLDQSGPAESDFRESIALAHQMHAKAWELRSTTSLARLLVKQGRRNEARKMLGEIYDWFTEGFDTPDLKDAQAMLDELGR